MSQIVTLPLGGTIQIVHRYLPDADALLAHLSTDVPWTCGVYNFGGRDVPTPRLLWAMRDPDYDIRHSYTVTESHTWTDPVVAVRDKIANEYGIYARYAQLNMYRTGRDSISWHSDREVHPDDHVVSLSLGGSRVFQFRPKPSAGKKHPPVAFTMTLDHNTLVIMDRDAASTYYQHQIPKTSEPRPPRISITFRER